MQLFCKEIVPDIFSWNNPGSSVKGPSKIFLFVRFNPLLDSKQR